MLSAEETRELERSMGSASDAQAVKEFCEERGYAVEDVLGDALLIAWELGYDEGSNEIIW